MFAVFLWAMAHGIVVGALDSQPEEDH